MSLYVKLQGVVMMITLSQSIVIIHIQSTDPKVDADTPTVSSGKASQTSFHDNMHWAVTLL